MNFCELVFNSKYNEFEGSAEIDHYTVNILVLGIKEECIIAAYALTNRVLTWFLANKEIVRKYAASEELLKLKNTCWLEEEEDELTQGEFESKLVLESIVINSDASLVVWYGDGNIFWGHGIRVSVSPGLRLVAAEML